MYECFSANVFNWDCKHIVCEHVNQLKGYSGFTNFINNQLIGAAQGILHVQFWIFEYVTNWLCPGPLGANFLHIEDCRNPTKALSFKHIQSSPVPETTGRMASLKMSTTSCNTPWRRLHMGTTRSSCKMQYRLLCIFITHSPVLQMDTHYF